MKTSPEEQFSPETPHNTLSSPLGRLVDRNGYKSIGFAALFVIFASAVYFFLASETPNGLDKKAGKDFWECLYFSVITFTTVGYGDLTPLGWGRMVVALEVVSGLCLTAAFIGKIASERQSALLLLIYTSDQQRRLAEFSDEMEQFAIALQEKPAPETVLLERSGAFLSALRSYLVFQSHQGRLADFGNGSALRQLYRMMDKFADAAGSLLGPLTLTPTLEEEVLMQVARLDRIAEIMEKFHPGDKRACAMIREMRAKTGKLLDWEKNGVTVTRLALVLASVPPKPWPKHFHKGASEALKISTGLYRQCLDHLKSTGYV